MLEGLHFSSGLGTPWLLPRGGRESAQETNLTKNPTMLSQPRVIEGGVVTVYIPAGNQDVLTLCLHFSIWKICAITAGHLRHYQVLFYHVETIPLLMTSLYLAISYYLQTLTSQVCY